MSAIAAAPAAASDISISANELLRFPPAAVLASVEVAAPALAASDPPSYDDSLLLIRPSLPSSTPPPAFTDPVLSPSRLRIPAESFANITYPNGDRYFGMVRNDSRNGLGTMIYANGSSYSGNWLHDRRHGKGVMFSPASSARPYEGDWRNEPDSHNRLYRGTWANDLRHGPGREGYSNNVGFVGVREGAWVNGQSSGRVWFVDASDPSSQQYCLEELRRDI